MKTPNVLITKAAPSQSQQWGFWGRLSIVQTSRPLLLAMIGLGFVGMPALAFASRSESAAIQVMNQLVRQFTLRTTVGQVNQGLQGLVVESGGKLRGPAMAAGVTNFPADMGTVPTGLGLPSRDGAGRLLGYCAWDNNSGSNSSSYLGGASAVTPIVYAVLSPGLDGAINTSCADIASSFAASGDDYVEIRYPQNTASQQFKTSVSTVAALGTTAGSDGDVRLVLENNKLYTYDSGSWTEVTAGSAGGFGDDSATNGAGAISYTTGKVTVAEFAATAATFSSNISVTGTSTLTGAVTAANGITVSSGGINVTGASSITGALTVSSGATVTGTVAATAFSGNGSALTNLSASNISSGTLGTAFGGTGVDASQASNGSLLIGTGNGFALGALTGTANQLTVTNSSGGIQLSLPQNIASTSTPTFGGLMLNGAMTGIMGTFTGSLAAQRLILGDSTGGVTTPNLVIGSGAMAGTPSGDGANTAVGQFALGFNTSGAYNIAVGNRALYSNTTGYGNTALGAYSDVTAANLTYATAVGAYSQVSTSSTVVLGRTSDVVVIGATGDDSSGDKLQVTGNIGTLGSLFLKTSGSTAPSSQIYFGALNDSSDTFALGRINTSPDTSVLQLTLGDNPSAFGGVGDRFQIVTSSLGNGTGPYAVKHTFDSDGSAYHAGNLTVGGTGTFNGAVSAASFSGSGASLTNLNAGNISSGTLAVARGGTGVTATPTNGQLLIGNGTGYTLANLTGTSNQVNVTNSSGGITLSLPQSIATSSTPTFGGLTLSGALAGTSATFSGNIAVGGNLTTTGDIELGTVANPAATRGKAIFFSTAADTPWGMYRAAAGANRALNGGTASAALDGSTGYALRLRGSDFPGESIIFENGSNTTLMSLSNTTGNLSVRGSLTVSTANTTGGGLVLGDDGDIVDLNDSYASMRFTAGVRIYSGNRSGSSVIQLGSNGNGVFSGSVSATRLNVGDSGSNVAIGPSTFLANTSGVGNVALGVHALVSNTTGYHNVAIGTEALRYGTTGFANTAVGSAALLSNTTGYNNVAIGPEALRAGTTGFANIAIGTLAFSGNTTGAENTVLGAFSLGEFGTGNRNVAIGVETGSRDGSRVLTGGSDNSFIGAYSGPASGVSTLNYATALGAYAEVGTDNTIVLGRTTDKTVIGATGEDGSGNILQVTGSVKATAFNTSSDRRLKTDINQLGDSLLGNLSGMGAYSYRFIADANNTMRYGVIAQEIAPLFPFAVSYDRNGIMAVDYGALGAIAAAGVGKLNTKLNTLSTQVTTQSEKLTALEKDLLKVDDRVKTLEAWKTDTAVRLDTMQTAINLNIEKIAEHALKIATNTEKITTLEAATQDLGTRMVTAENGLAKLNADWAGTFAKSEDGQTLTVLTPNLVASNFSAEQVRARSAYTERLEAEMARIATLEVDDLRANRTSTGTLRAGELNTGSAQVFASNGIPTYLFATAADGHYTVNVNAADGSYITASVMVSGGLAKVVTVSNDGIDLLAEGTMVKAVANGKSLRASWIKTG